ncbi:hypothetical protein QYM36_004208 [Artemia franciscana]|uniref:Uncharacterized protein n=2 Tax=Artemia franciscana TaxID=6661 RepID=A0AA88IEB2_ARTSF|nr:hypothetical protein QYM36_004208 [Artemia franciscana]
MSDKPAADRACKDPNPIIDGRKANVNLAYLGAKPRGNVAASFPLAGLRAGFPTLLPSQFGLQHQLIYQSPFVTPQNVMQLPAANQNALSQATMAALASQFYDPVAAAAAYAAQFTGVDQLAYSNAAAGAAGLVGPAFTYASALPTGANQLQAVATNPLHFSAYATQTGLQEARMQ